LSELTKEILIFAASLFFLVKSADYFVEYSEKLGLSLRVPQFIIGMTIVSIGTSLPELVTSVFSVLEGETGMVAGNVIGSNIANILLVVGISTIIARKIEINRSIIRLDLPLLVGSGAILILTMKDGVFTFPEAIISIFGFLIYLLYNVAEHKAGLVQQEEDRIKTLEVDKKPPFKFRYISWIVTSAIGLYFSGKFTVSSVIGLGTMLSLDTSVLAITAVAIGTSLPELLVSIMAVKKGNFDMTLGNVFGSNIFNGFMVMGVAGLISPLQISKEVLEIGVPIFSIATIFLVFSGIERKFYNFEGALYLIIYLLFIGQLFHFI